MLHLNIFSFLYFNTVITVVLSSILSVLAFSIKKKITQSYDRSIIEASWRDCFANYWTMVSYLNRVFFSFYHVWIFNICTVFMYVSFQNVITEESKHKYNFFSCYLNYKMIVYNVHCCSSKWREHEVLDKNENHIIPICPPIKLVSLKEDWRLSWPLANLGTRT